MQFTRIAANATATVCGREVGKSGHEQQCTAWSFFFYYYLVFHLLWPASGDCVDLFCAALRWLFISQETKTTTEVTTKLQSASSDGQTMANMPQSTVHKETTTRASTLTTTLRVQLRFRFRVNVNCLTRPNRASPRPDLTRQRNDDQLFLSEMAMRSALYKLSQCKICHQVDHAMVGRLKQKN